MTTNETLIHDFGTAADQMTLAEYSTVDEFMNKVFHKNGSTGLPAGASHAKAAGVDETDTTSRLIEGASNAIDFLSTRCEILEVELDQMKEACAEQDNVIESWKKMAHDLRAKAAAIESDWKAMAVRCQNAETRIVELEQEQKTVTLRAAKAENVSSKLQQQVEAAFGKGSPIRSVMDSVSLKQAAE